MSLQKILSVAGKPGLYRLVAQMKNGIIVESLDDAKRYPVHGAAKVSALNEISIYTNDAELPLRDVFKRMFEKTGGKPGPDHRTNESEAKSFFTEIVPDFDAARVYPSDMVKTVKWFNQLVEKGGYTPEEEKEEEAEVPADDTAADQPKKAKKVAAVKADKSAAQRAGKAVTKSKSGGAAVAPRKTGGTSRGS